MFSPLLLLASAAANQPASTSGYLNAGDLMNRCESMSAPMLSYCFAYIAGAHDAVKAYEAWLNIQEYCVPAATPQGDLRRVFVEYVKANPGYRAGEAASVVIVALKEKYACNASASSPIPPR